MTKIKIWSAIQIGSNIFLVFFFCWGAYQVFGTPGPSAAVHLTNSYGVKAPKKSATRAPANLKGSADHGLEELLAKTEAETEPTAPELPTRTPFSTLQREARLQHAQELLGKYYNRSVVRSGEKFKKINSKVYRFVRQRLPKKYQKKYKKIAQAIIDESLRNEFDPLFLVSVILGESSFDPDKKGPVDEIGLMQIRPATGEWIAKKYGLKWKGVKTLRDPIRNIKIGAAYLHHLREKFDSHAQLYLAAYNMGARNVDEALEKKVWPKDYPLHVMRRYLDLYTSLETGELEVRM
ncbi:MAG: lytic transglycosylase domain-containing protein [Bdellovibrionales bacterium]